jgi:hypothetical protein
MESYTAYTKTITSSDARAFFTAKHGYPPAVVEDGGPIWLVGPIRSGPGLHAPLLRGKQAPLLSFEGPSNQQHPGGLVRRATAASKPMYQEQALQLVMKFRGSNE